MTISPRRICAVAVAAFAVALAAPTAALADTTFETVSSTASASGATLVVVRAVALDDGTVVYEEIHYKAGPNGASKHTVTTSAR